jgi:hypothetical protein
MHDLPILLRGLERLLITAGAFFCFWLCFKFQETNQTSDGKFKWEGLSVELKKVGPSVFFALFGAAILIVSLSKPLEYTDKPDAGSPGTTRSFHYLMSDDATASLKRDLNAMVNLERVVRSNELTADDRGKLADILARAANHKRTLFELTFGSGTLAEYEDYEARCNKQTSQECDAARDRLGKDRVKDMEQFYAS